MVYLPQPRAGSLREDNHLTLQPIATLNQAKHQGRQRCSLVQIAQKESFFKWSECAESGIPNGGFILCVHTCPYVVILVCVYIYLLH